MEVCGFVRMFLFSVVIWFELMMIVLVFWVVIDLVFIWVRVEINFRVGNWIVFLFIFLGVCILKGIFKCLRSWCW